VTVHNLFDEATVIRQGQEGMPSVRAIVINAQALGLGMTVIGDFEAVRLPHPRLVIGAVIRLARLWDETYARIESIRSCGQDLAVEVETSVEACEHGHVTLVFSTPIDSVMLDPASAEALGTDLMAAARDVRGGADAGAKN